MKRGLVIGKFYPPHRGHHFLIETAAEQIDQLDVLVCWKEEQTIPGELRAQWIREEHSDRPNVRVLTVRDFGDDDNSAAWASCTKDVLGYAPDVVFTSEDYGEPFARLLGATHVMVDRSRQRFPVSGTTVRADPRRFWTQLSLPARAWYAIRVAIVGAESTGTTTLARALAEHYRTTWVPEYGREYCEQLILNGESVEDDRWRTEEFVHIAETQAAREDLAARNCNGIVFCDTEAIATSIWHERYVGYESFEVNSLAKPHKYALYVLTDQDIPFVQDGLRDGERIREWMTERFTQKLNDASVPWVRASGSHQKRMHIVTTAIEDLREVRLGPIQDTASTSSSSHGYRDKVTTDGDGSIDFKGGG